MVDAPPAANSLSGAGHCSLFVFYCVFWQSQLVLTSAKDLLIPAATLNSQCVIWRSCSPQLAHIDRFYVPAEFSTVSEESSPPHPNPFVFSANEILMRGPGLFFHVFFYFFSLSLSSLLFSLYTLSIPLCCLSSLSLFLCFWCNLQADGGENESALFCV